MAPRGLSKEEKRVKMLEIFHESADFFSLKEIEKIASKQKGIVLPTVKEVLEEVKSDGLVTAEKIGTGIYYWSFPSAAGAQKQGLVDRLAKDVADIEGKIAGASAESASADAGREDTAERRRLLAELKEEQAKAESMAAELAAFGAADPLKYEKKKQATEVAKRATSRWTDNILVCFFVLKNAGAEEENVRAMLNLADDWDDLELIKQASGPVVYL